MKSDWDRVNSLAAFLKRGEYDEFLRRGSPVVETLTDKKARGCLLGMLATACLARQDWSQSIRFGTLALQDDAAQRHVHANRVAALYRRGDSSRALADAHRLVAAHPDYALGYFHRSVCFLVAASEASHTLKPIFVRHSLADIDHAIALDPADRGFAAHQRLLHSIVGPEVQKAESSLDGWELAGNIATVVGKLLGGVIG